MLGKKTSVLSSLASPPADSSAEHFELCGGAEHCCLSATGGEVGDDSSSVSSRSSKLHLAGWQTPRFRINSSSPGLDRKKPDVVPKPPHVARAQVQAKA